MTADHIAALKRVYEGWGRGDFSTGLDLMEENAVLVLNPEFPDAGAYVGRAALAEYMRGFLEPWERLTIEALSFRSAGDSVLVTVRQSAQGAGSGAPVELVYFQLWTFRGGKAIRQESIKGEAEALAAAGLGGDSSPAEG